MSTGSITTSSGAGAPISFSGIASGLDTSSIISALMAAERAPVTRLSDQQTRTQAQQQELQTLQTSLQQLSLAVSEFSLPSLFASNQSVTSSEPQLISAAAGAGAGIGGYEVEVSRLASSGQRTFTFTAPSSEQTLTVAGRSYTLKAGETAKELAATINSDQSGDAYAAVVEESKIVLSTRETGASGTGFLQVSSGGALTEVAGSAREGADAEFTVDGVAGTSKSNTVTNAIAGVTLTLSGLTSGQPVTIDVGAPGPSASAVESQLQSFVKLYNSTVEAIGKQLSTRPPAHGQSATELATGTLYEDNELAELLSNMRQAMYEPIAGLAGEVHSPADIGISTGAPSGSAATSQTALEGLLKLEPAKLSSALQADPAGVQEMLRQWSLGLQKAVEAVSGPSGGLEARIQSDAQQISEASQQISNLNELLAQREHALQLTYAQLESVISQNTAQSNWLVSQEKALTAG